MNSRSKYRYWFAVYRYDYIGIGIGIGMAISVEPYGSGYSRDKFRVPTRPILKRKMFNFILHYTHLDGVCKIFYVGKKIVPRGPYITGLPDDILAKMECYKKGDTLQNMFTSDV